MNVGKYLNSRLGKTLEQIKKAYLSNKHICFIVCSEPEFIEELICSSSLFPNCKPSKSDSDASIKFVDSDSFINSALCKSISNDNQQIAKPQLYIYNCSAYYCNGNMTEDIQLPLQSLTNYVNQITSLSHVNFKLTIGQKKRLNCLKESLILIPVKSQPQVPVYIEPYSETIVVPFMGELEFKEFVSDYLECTELVTTSVDDNGYRMVGNNHYLTKLYHNMRGLNATQIKSTLCKNQMLLGRIYYVEDEDKYEVKIAELIKNIRKEFERLVETSRALTLEESSVYEPAGLTNLITCLKEYKEQVANPHDFTKYILEAPKGLLVSGVPGSGKSMVASYIAGLFGLSLVRLDFGNLGGGLVGESEKNMDYALRMIEALSPCVLWVDEMEKAFSGSNGKSVHETTKRLFGKFLTWMQEKGKKGISCFVFATANDISQMPPEMFRSGRFDDKFFTFMPTSTECANIFKSIILDQTNKYKGRESRNLQAKPLFNTKKINDRLFMDLINNKDLCLLGFSGDISDRSVNRKNKFFTGADIDQVIKKAKILYLNGSARGMSCEKDAIFASERFVKCLIEAISITKTYGETNLDDIAKCYAQLAVNNFNNVSDEVILPFDGYDELAYISKEKDDKVDIYDLDRYNNGFEKYHYKKLKTDYDKCLFIIIRNAINQLAKEIIRRRLS